MTEMGTRGLTGRRESAFCYDALDPMFGALVAREGEEDGSDGEGDNDGEGGEGNDGGDGSDSKTAEMAKEIERMRDTIQRLNRENAQRRKKLDEFNDVDTDEYRRLKAEAEAREREKQEKAGEYEKLLEAERAKTREARVELDQERAKYQNEKVSGALLSAGGGLDAMPEALEGGEDSQLVRIYGNQFHVVEGHVVHRSKMNDEGHPMSPKEFLESERAGAGRNLFKSMLKDGPGTKPGESGGDGTVVKIRRDDPKRLQKVEQAKKAGHRVDYI